MFRMFFYISSIWSCCPTWPCLLSVKSLHSGPSFGAQAFPSSHCRGPGLRENSWAACSSVHQCQSLQRCRGSLALGNTSASTAGMKPDRKIMAEGNFQGNQILQGAMLLLPWDHLKEKLLPAMLLLTCWFTFRSLSMSHDMSIAP